MKQQARRNMRQRVWLSRVVKVLRMKEPPGLRRRRAETASQ